MKFRRFGAAAVCLRDLYLWLSENHCNQSNKFRAGPTQFASPRYSLRSSPNFLHMTSPMTLCKRMLEWGKPRWTMHGGMAWRYTSYHSWLKTLYFQLFWDKRIWQSACIFKIRFAPLYIFDVPVQRVFPLSEQAGYRVNASIVYTPECTWYERLRQSEATKGFGRLKSLDPWFTTVQSMFPRPSGCWVSLSFLGIDCSKPRYMISWADFR